MTKKNYAKIYAEKFLEHCKKNDFDFEKNLKQKIENLNEIFENQSKNERNKTICNYLKSKSIQFSKKIELIKEICDEKIFLNFLQVVEKFGHLDFLDRILKNIITAWLRSQCVVHASVQSVIKLDQTQIGQIKSLILKQTGFEANIVNHINKNILGGFIIEFDDLILDMSIAGILNKIEAKFFG